jgi:hypothetical protein
MRLRILCASMIVVSASGIPDAIALPPTPGPEVELYISGSSAQDEALENLIRLPSGTSAAPGLCETGSLDIYRGTIGGTENRVFYCRTGHDAAGIAPGLRLAIYKSSGGSGEGVTPVASATALPFLDLAKLPQKSSCLKGEAVKATAALAAYTNHVACDNASKLAKPRAGLSDVNPELVGAVTTALTVRPQNQIVWGLPVSKNLRNALQTIQGLVASTVPHDDPLRDAEASMPSLARAQVAALYAGAVRSWDLFYDRNGTPITRSALLAPGAPADPDASGASPGAYRPTAAAVYICRRIAASGTQAAYEVHYLRARCESNALQFLAPNDGSGLTTGGDVGRLVRVARPPGTVFAGVGTADVRDCLDAHAQFNRWAIGLLSTENVGNNGSRKFRYVKVDGVAPTLLNAYLGRWPHVTEQSMQWRKSFDASLTTTPEGRVLGFVATNLGLPQVIAALNSGFMHPWGQGGYLAPPTGGFAEPKAPVTAEELRLNPVGNLTRSLGRLDDCNEPVVLHASGL